MKRRLAITMTVTVLAALAALSVTAASATDRHDLKPYRGASGRAFVYIDNSGNFRGAGAAALLCKERSDNGRLMQFRVDLEPTTSTKWMPGISLGPSFSGCARGQFGDTYSAPDEARGVWLRLCVDKPGSVERCGKKVHMTR